MMGKRNLLIILACCLSFCLVGAASALTLNDKKVLVVMSYHHGNTWQDQQREAIDAALGDARITYFYLDTKRNEAGGPAKAVEAFALYQQVQPDVVVAADDLAQELFVVPYLKDKVPTPVVFLAVNDDAAKYGFPAGNVTGVIEIKHFQESISFAQLLVAGLKRMTILYTDNQSNRLNVEELKKQQATFPAEIVRYVPLRTFAELERAVPALVGEVDAFFSLNLSGLVDEKGLAMEATDSMAKLALLSPKPIIAADSYDIESGALCGVIKTGQEQGELAARMVLELFNGKAAKDIPLTRNKNGLRYINVTTAKRLGIPLQGAVVMGTKLVK